MQINSILLRKIHCLNLLGDKFIFLRTFKRTEFDLSKTAQVSAQSKYSPSWGQTSPSSQCIFKVNSSERR